ncbi:MAG TPA: hypothetical protein EYN03_08585, partial [Planctomycetes bacterium]|nr:hypothetical protein [Planctomycetaceae bacterium]HIN95689.1 hypothetical protein [Planctomycetota bacterium]
SLPVVVVWLASVGPAWVFMWTLACSVYFGLKWLSFSDGIATTRSTVGRSFGYLLLWAGMDAKSFLASSAALSRPSLVEWCLAVSKLVLGLGLLVVGLLLIDVHHLVAGWFGMIGLLFMLHFGLFHLLSILWRRAGVDAAPIMDAPILASSLSDFWGRRWNLAFRDLSHTYIFRPLVGRLGIAGATMAVFLVSGIVHDLVISIPAAGGLGLPTLYFVIQGSGVLFERSRLGKRLGTRKGVRGRIFCAVVTLGPICLLFHSPFIDRVIIPMLRVIGSAGG